MVFIRKNKNRSGSYSIQIVFKQRGTYKVLKTLGSGRSAQEIEFLYQRARQEIHMLEGLGSLFVDEDDTKIESFISSLSNDSVQVIGPELIGVVGSVGIGPATDFILAGTSAPSVPIAKLGAFMN